MLWLVSVLRTEYRVYIGCILHLLFNVIMRLLSTDPLFDNLVSHKQLVVERNG